MNTEGFLRKLYCNYETQINVSGYIEVRLAKGRRDVAYYKYNSLNALIKDYPNLYKTHNIHKYNVYYGVPAIKDVGNNKIISHFPAFWADLDNPHTLYRIIKSPLRPTLVVSSGSGYHLYWVMEKPIENNAKNNRLHNILRAWCISDTRVKDFMRLPGTINYKDITKHNPCTVIDFYDTTYSVENLEQYFKNPLLVLAKSYFNKILTNIENNILKFIYKKKGGGKHDNY